MSQQGRVLKEPPPIDIDRLKKDFDISNFDLNAILRGAQLTVVGAFRALQNPDLFQQTHYRQAAIAVGAGIAITLAVHIPILLVHILLWFTSFFVDFERATWDDSIVDGLQFMAKNVLQVPLFLMTLMSHITPTLDNMFMDSLRWVDRTYEEKHKRDDPAQLREMYYPNLRLYSTKGNRADKSGGSHGVPAFLMRFAKKGAMSLAIYALSYVPVFGRLVLPAASFYTFRNAVGTGPATVIFGTGLFLPRRYLIVFMQAYYSSRSLTRELLTPYFSRIRFTKEQKKNWFRDREGLLFGFGVGFYLFLRIPLFGVLIYGIAEASTAYLITKITDPPPPPTHSEGFAASQQRWKNKHEFLSLNLTNMDSHRPSNDTPLVDMTPQATSSAVPSEPPPPYERSGEL